MHDTRKPMLQELEAARDSKVLLFATGDRPGWETQIAGDSFDWFVEHLDALGGKVDKISIMLYTRGGQTTAAWSLINLIRQFCRELEVIVPHKAHSAGTLICLGAENILMTKQATLGPIDPSANNPLNPEVPGSQNQRVPVSVEEVKGYVDLAKEELEGVGGSELVHIYLELTKHIHPLVLGQIYRLRSQIKYLARKLLAHQVDDDDAKIDRIISFLCSDSGSHDYTINRREAKEDLGLNIESPDDDLYKLVKEIYADFRDEMDLAVPHDPAGLVASTNPYQYENKRVIIESEWGGCHAFVSRGQLALQQNGSISDSRTFEGWEKIA